MAGDRTPYTHLPSFYSDLFDLGYEAVGAMDPQGEPWPTGRMRFVKEWSITSPRDAYAACCSGTPGARSMPLGH